MIPCLPPSTAPSRRRPSPQWQSPVHLLGIAAYTNPRETGRPSCNDVWISGNVYDQHAQHRCSLHSFPHNISKYELIEDLPELLDNVDNLPDDVDEWLVYCPQACPRARGSYTYTSVLLGFHEPFPKVIKAMASWFQKTKFGLWKSLLQLEKPTVLGWLLFSTSTMDEEVLRGKISLCI